uniref:SIR2 family protein n=1 Tax=Stappia sp. TaxID=1870903 RepID=UPI003BABA31A
MIEWPQQLLKDLKDRRVVVFLGSGVSRNSIGRDGVKRPPLWKDFLEIGLNRIGKNGTAHIKKAIRDCDYLHACEWIKNKLDEDWIPLLRQEFYDPAYNPSEMHDAIFRLDQRIYLTPNFDNIFDNFVSHETGGLVSVKEYCSDDVHSFLRDDRLYIIKIHGSIDSPNDVIFTYKDYASARVKHAAFYDVLDACLLSHTFLIIGCGISDPDLALLLENQKFNFPSSRPHYLVTSSKMSNDLKTSLRGNRNLKCITYDPANSHEELLASLKELVGYLDVQSD